MTTILASSRFFVLCCLAFIGAVLLAVGEVGLLGWMLAGVAGGYSLSGSV